LKERLFAIGDIHGCIDQLVKLVESTINVCMDDRIIFLGDYIDRGENSREVIEYILNLKKNGLNVITLIGNHESMLLDALRDESRQYNWLFNGGSYTLDSFGIASLSELDGEYVEFFQSLQYFFSFGNFIFVHAGFNNSIPYPFEDTNAMIWTRNELYTNPAFNDKVIVHGHTPVALEVCRQMAKQESKVINIDTGCVYSNLPGFGYLTALEINTMRLYSV
jgi:serine/threonine protein phosphatase 1